VHEGISSNLWAVKGTYARLSSSNVSTELYYFSSFYLQSIETVCSFPFQALRVCHIIVSCST
jgi:hypothetical protein